MKRISQTTFLLTILAVGFSAGTLAADEPSDKPQPKLIQAKQPQIQAIKQQRTFSGLLQKGQTVTLYQFGQEALYQVRIVSDDQKKQIEEVVERNRKELQDLQSKISALDKETQDTADSGSSGRNASSSSASATLNEMMSEDVRRGSRRSAQYVLLRRFEYWCRDVAERGIGGESWLDWPVRREESRSPRMARVHLRSRLDSCFQVGMEAPTDGARAIEHLGRASSQS